MSLFYFIRDGNSLNKMAGIAFQILCGFFAMRILKVADFGWLINLAVDYGFYFHKIISNNKPKFS